MVVSKLRNQWSFREFLCERDTKVTDVLGSKVKIALPNSLSSQLFSEANKHTFYSLVCFMYFCSKSGEKLSIFQDLLELYLLAKCTHKYPVSFTGIENTIVLSVRRQPFM